MLWTGYLFQSEIFKTKSLQINYWLRSWEQGPKITWNLKLYAFKNPQTFRFAFILLYAHCRAFIAGIFFFHQIQYDSEIDTNQDNKNDSSYEGPNINPALRDTTTYCVYLILASFVVYRKEVNLVIVSAWHLVLWTSLLYRQHYIVALSSDKCPVQMSYNVLIVSHFGDKRLLLNALNVNVNVNPAFLCIGHQSPKWERYWYKSGQRQWPQSWRPEH